LVIFREPAMSAPRLGSKTPIHFHAPAAMVALTGIVPVLAVMALSSAVPKPDFLNFLPSPAAASNAPDPIWAGHLDAFNSASPAAEVSEVARSTSYTSGFDPAAVGLAPLKTAPVTGRIAQRDPRACADETVDKVADIGRTASACSKSVKVFVLPLPRPAALKTVVAADKPAQSQATGGLTDFTSHLPSPYQLLTPFNYVGDKVAGLFKRS
jgi:hypothetical protein